MPSQSLTTISRREGLEQQFPPTYGRKSGVTGAVTERQEIVESEVYANPGQDLRKRGKVPQGNFLPLHFVSLFLLMVGENFPFTFSPFKAYEELMRGKR